MATGTRGGSVEIKVLGSGCPKCRRLEALAREAAQELGIDATFIKVKDIDEITSYDIISTPALVIDEEVKVSGRIPDKQAIKAWLAAA
jgi:small redox-active disulfide protein 2